MGRTARAALIVALIVGCGSATSTSAPTPEDAGVPPVEGGVEEAAAATRATGWASSGARLVTAPTPAIVLGSADLAADVDAVLIHQEFYGLPWDAFRAATPPPAEWVSAIDALVEATKTIGRPVLLSLQLVSGSGRRFLADRTVIDNGVVRTQSGWSTPCYDFGLAPDGAANRAAYLAYVDWMVRRFNPRWVNVAIEMNMFLTCGDGPWNALVAVERAAYDTVKAVSPTALAFPSFQTDVLQGWGPDCTQARDECFDAAYSKLTNVARDRFAVTSFPYLVEATRDPNSLRDDWLTRAGDRGGERTIVAETGWLASPLVVQRGMECVPAIASDEARQRAYFGRVRDAALRGQIELVTWVSGRDVMPASLVTECPCAFDPTWCGFLDAYRQSVGPSPDAQASAEFTLKMFGALGIRTYDGSPRAGIFDDWQAARSSAWRGFQ